MEPVSSVSPALQADSLPLAPAEKHPQNSENHSVVSDSLWPYGLYSPWNSPGQNTGAGSLSLLQGIFPTQGSNPGLPHCRWILYQLSHKGSPRILEWIACPLSSRSSWPRNGTRVSCLASRFFTNWAIREALKSESESRSIVSNSLQPNELHSPGFLQARILEWVAFPFSTGSCQPIDQTQVSLIAGKFFTSWATREAKEYWGVNLSLLQ